MMTAAELNRATMCAETVEALDNLFLDKELSEDQKYRVFQIQTKVLELAKSIVACVPGSPSRTKALNKLQELQMYCNTSIRTEGRF